MKFFYFIRHPLGGGGHHLANLLSLDATISPCLPAIESKQEWITLLFNHYKNIDVHTHFVDSENSLIVSDAGWKSYIDSLADDVSSVHTGHAANFDWAKDVLDQLANKRYILLTFNSEQSRNIVKQREKTIFDTETLKNSYYIEELCHIYNRWFKDDVLCDDDINCAIEIQDLFVENIHPVINRINQHFGLNIPLDQAQVLHSLWLLKQTCNINTQDAEWRSSISSGS